MSQIDQTIELGNRTLRISPRIAADVLRLVEVTKRNKDRLQDYSFNLYLSASAVSDALRAYTKGVSLLKLIGYIKALFNYWYTPARILARYSAIDIMSAYSAVLMLENKGEESLKKKVEMAQSQTNQ